MPAIINSISGDQSVCEGIKPNQLIGTAQSGGQGNFTYVWESSTTSATTGFSQAIGANSTQNYDVAILSATTYFRRKITSGGCDVYSNVVKITVSKAPAVPIVKAANVVICKDSSATLQATAPSGSTFQWFSSETGGTPLSNEAIYRTPTLSSSTTFYVQAVSAAQCTSLRRTAVSVTVTTITVTASRDTTIREGQQVTLFASGGQKYEWTPRTGLSNPDAPGPLATPLVTTTYKVTVTSEAGCVASEEVTITVIPRVIIANSFSPNRDGINETWALPNIENFPQATVEIYNRFGSLIFKSTDGYKTPWDGTYKGNALPLATYYYVIRLQPGEKPLTGHITLIR